MNTSIPKDRPTPKVASADGDPNMTSSERESNEIEDTGISSASGCR